MATTLVTGCTGLLGANLCYILKDDDRVIGLSRSPFAMKGVEHFSISFEDVDEVARIIERGSVNRVVHCAALTNVDYCELHSDEAMRVNCDASVALARECALLGAKFVFISTDAVFDGRKSGAYVEDDDICPINVYGESKARAEEGVLDVPGSLVVRTNLYGTNYQDKSSFGEWIIRALSSGETLTMFEDVFFSPLVADTLAQAIVAAMDANASGVLNLSSTGGISKLAFGELLKEQMNLGGSIVPVSVDNFNFTAKRSHNMVLDNNRATTLLEMRLPTPEEGLGHFIAQCKGGFRQILKEGAL